MAPHTRTPSLVWCCCPTIKCGPQRWPGRLQTRIVRSSVSRENSDSSLDTTRRQSSSCHVVRSRQMIARARRCPGHNGRRRISPAAVTSPSMVRSDARGGLTACHLTKRSSLMVVHRGLSEAVSALLDFVNDMITLLGGRVYLAALPRPTRTRAEYVCMWFKWRAKRRNVQLPLRDRRCVLSQSRLAGQRLVECAVSGHAARSVNFAATNPVLLKLSTSFGNPFGRPPKAWRRKPAVKIINYLLVRRYCSKRLCPAHRMLYSSQSIAELGPVLNENSFMGSALPYVNTVRVEHCTPFRSLAFSGDGALDARWRIVLIVPRASGPQERTKASGYMSARRVGLVTELCACARRRVSLFPARCVAPHVYSLSIPSRRPPPPPTPLVYLRKPPAANETLKTALPRMFRNAWLRRGSPNKHFVRCEVLPASYVKQASALCARPSPMPGTPAKVTWSTVTNDAVGRKGVQRCNKERGHCAAVMNTLLQFPFTSEMSASIMEMKHKYDDQTNERGQITYAYSMRIPFDGTTRQYFWTQRRKRTEVDSYAQELGDTTKSVYCARSSTSLVLTGRHSVAVAAGWRENVTNFAGRDAVIRGADWPTAPGPIADQRCQFPGVCDWSLRGYARLHHRGSKLDPRSDPRSTQKTCAPFEFRAGLEIEMKFIWNRRNWRFEISIQDQQPSSTNIDESEIQNRAISLVQHFYNVTKIKLYPGSELTSFDLGSGKMMLWLDCSPTTKANRVPILAMSPPGFSHVGIVPDDADGRDVFSGMSRFPRACIPVLYPYHGSPSLAPKTLMLRAFHTRPECSIP
ncbi:hypothetical protein PR048_016863 [Dryococelus australis]|uniref:Uncharacterized protein n=1 Tax=Dryococelus australis TaxID=614101 RepID=A0ABQ9H800_9NEOP|nr:hypothetical protein PR048_016863 [Dryococelus australis]